MKHFASIFSKNRGQTLLKAVFVFGALLPLLSCSPQTDYSGELHTLTIRAVYPEGFEKWCRSGVDVEIEDILTGTGYTATTNAKGEAQISLVNGNYRIRISDLAVDEATGDEFIFNGSGERTTLVGEDKLVQLKLSQSIPGSILVKEIYCGSCQKYPEEGTYMGDSYVVLHNNSSVPRSLDGLCFGVADPYNSVSTTNVWISVDKETGGVAYPDFVPIAQAIWQFPGDGSSHVLQPGEDAVLAIFGAIDHTAKYPYSVNLNDPSYFVCYNIVSFWNTKYHPAPGDKIQQDHIMNLPIKLGKANAYTFSINSPAVVLFKAPDGENIQDFLKNTNKNITIKPGTTDEKIVKLPLDWVVDAVEVFTNNINGSTKRLNPLLDAGYVRLSESYQGRVLYRRVNSAMSEKRGYEVLQDTNNSSSDFSESQRNGQSLRKK